MKTTYFRPSIHGWPFGNSWKRSFVFEELELSMGFCGGMCWRALQRFYSAIPIPRDTPKPSEGEPLYDEIWNAQTDSVPASTVWQIYDWQMSPDLSHKWNPKHSLGHRTQNEWPKVHASLDQSKPVTLTLIVSSNDENMAHLSNHHRVVAYAYDSRSVIQGDGAPSGAETIVTLYIYDPNFPDDDDVKLTFFLGGDDSNIQLRHNKGSEVHGFFADDKNRNYVSAEPTTIRIDNCIQTGINSKTRADYDLEFSWQCRFIPYFNILIDGMNWGYNNSANEAKSRYQPINSNYKQCPAKSGHMTVNLKLPRALSTVAVRFLDDDAYVTSIEVDAKPAFNCYPYLRRRAKSDRSQICDYDIQATDLFIRDDKPDYSEVQQLDTSPFRWIIEIKDKPYVDRRGVGDDLTTAYVEVFNEYWLGNVSVPIMANFTTKNLASPTDTSGIVKIVRHGQTVSSYNLSPLVAMSQKIFDGFQNNPADYDEDTRVEFQYRAKDKYGVEVTGYVEFYGQSIIFFQNFVTLWTFDSGRIARFEAIAHGLVELGLIDFAIEQGDLPHGPGGIIERLRHHKQLQQLIAKELSVVKGDPESWRLIWKAQLSAINQPDQPEMIPFDRQTEPGELLQTTTDLKLAAQRAYDALAANILVAKTCQRLRQNPKVRMILKSLSKRVVIP